MIYVVLAEDDLLLYEEAYEVSDVGFIFYGSTPDASAYFSKLLYGQRWLETERYSQLRALQQATVIVNQLPYKDAPISAEMAFPQGDQTDVPVNVNYATYEIALSLVKGHDVDRAMAARSITAQGFSSRREARDPLLLPTHLQLGIPSKLAYDYLVPYLKNLKTVQFDLGGLGE